MIGDSRMPTCGAGKICGGLRDASASRLSFARIPQGMTPAAAGLRPTIPGGRSGSFEAASGDRRRAAPDDHVAPEAGGSRGCGYTKARPLDQDDRGDRRARPHQEGRAAHRSRPGVRLHTSGFQYVEGHALCQYIRGQSSVIRARPISRREACPPKTCRFVDLRQPRTEVSAPR